MNQHIHVRIWVNVNASFTPLPTNEMDALGRGLWALPEPFTFYSTYVLNTQISQYVRWNAERKACQTMR